MPLHQGPEGAVKPRLESWDETCWPTRRGGAAPLFRHWRLQPRFSHLLLTTPPLPPRGQTRFSPGTPQSPPEHPCRGRRAGRPTPASGGSSRTSRCTGGGLTTCRSTGCRLLHTAGAAAATHEEAWLQCKAPSPTGSGWQAQLLQGPIPPTPGQRHHTTTGQQPARRSVVQQTTRSPVCCVEGFFYSVPMVDVNVNVQHPAAWQRVLIS